MNKSITHIQQLFCSVFLLASISACTNADTRMNSEMSSHVKTNHVTASDSTTPGMTKLYYEVEVNTSKQKAWDIVSDFNNLSWTSTVLATHYTNDKRQEPGMTRHCDLLDNGYIVERITEWNQGSGYTYVIDDASDPIDPASYVIWEVRENGDSAIVSFEVHYDLKYGLIGDLINTIAAKKKFSNQIAFFMNELKNHAEI